MSTDGGRPPPTSQPSNQIATQQPTPISQIQMSNRNSVGMLQHAIPSQINLSQFQLGGNKLYLSIQQPSGIGAPGQQASPQLMRPTQSGNIVPTQPSYINTSNFAFPFPTQIISAGPNQFAVVRAQNQSEQLLIGAQFSPQFYVNQNLQGVAAASGVPTVAVSSGNPSVISLAPSQPPTATNRTQSIVGSQCLIAPAPTFATPSSNSRLKAIKPAQPLASIGTQTSVGTSNNSTLGSVGSSHSTTTSTTSMERTPLAKGKQSSTKISKLPADRPTQALFRQISPSQAQLAPAPQPTNIHVSPNAFSNQPFNQAPQASQLSLPTSSHGVPPGQSPMTAPSAPNPQAGSRTQAQMKQTMTVTLVNSEQSLGNQRLVPKSSAKADMGTATSPLKSVGNDTKMRDMAHSKTGSISERPKGRPSIPNKVSSNGICKERPLQSKKDNSEKRDSFTIHDTEMVNHPLDNVRDKSVFPGLCQSEISSKQSDGCNGLSRDAVTKTPQKAIVKPYFSDPNVLTHIIDGYVIQESPSPFPPMDYNNVGPDGALNDGKDDATEEESLANDAQDISSLTSSTPRNKLDGVCENCGKVGIRTRKKKQKKFCSKICATKFNDSKKSEIFNPTSNQPSDRNTLKAATAGREDAGAPSDYPMDETEGIYIPAGGNNPLLWSVQDVCDFVRNLPGCQEYADEFKSHEIDGQALMLLKEDHLMNTMNMKLGPALKICSRINSLFKAEASKSQA